MHKLLLSLLVLFFACSAAGQAGRTLSGSVQDSTGRPVPDISLFLCSDSDTLTAITGSDGNYRFSGLHAGRNTLTAMYTGTLLYDTTWDEGPWTDADVRLRPVIIRLVPKNLEEIIVRPPPVTVKEDTIQFNAGAYNVRDGATVEELVRKFPGVTVDRDGNVTAQGKAVVKVRVNGKDFFAGDLQTAMQNLPADIVRNIQIIDDYGDQATLTGIKTGEPQKIININTRKDKSHGDFGNMQAGVGTEGRYLGSVSINRFRDDQQLSVIATANNTSMNPGAGSSGKSFNAGLASAAPGITRTYSGGVNYKDKIGKKLTVYGSYGFTWSNTEISSLSYQQDLNPDDIRTTNRSSHATTERGSHRLNWTMEYAAGPNDLLKLSMTSAVGTSSGSTLASSGISRQRFFTSSENKNAASGTTADLNLNLIYNHRFRKAGRNLNINATWDYSAPEDEIRVSNMITDVDSAGADSSYTQPLIVNSLQRQRQQTISNRRKPGLSISYTEPLTAKLVAELSYTVSYEDLMRTRNVYDLDTGLGTEILNRGLSTDFQSEFLVSRYGLNIQSRHDKFYYVVGVILQPSRLEGISRLRSIETHTASTNWAPTARLVYRLSSMQTLNVNYNGNYMEPDFQKIQPLVDSTNPSNILIGNPNLKPEFTNRVSLGYSASDRNSGSVLFANISYDKTLNKIVNSVYNDPRSTSRTTTYLNDNGFYRINGSITAVRPFSARRFSVSAGLAGSFDNSIAYTDGERSNGRSWMLQPNARFQADIQNVLDAELVMSYGMNSATANYGAQVTRTETQTLTASLNGRFFIGDLICIGYSYDKQLNSGYGGATNVSPDIVNLYAEYRFSKRRAATVRLQAFDLLNENERISRNVSGTSITDNRFNGLRRYLMLTVNWRISHFGS